MAPTTLCLSLAVCLFVASSSVVARHANHLPVPAMPMLTVPWDGPVISANGSTLPPLNTTYYFDQLIDHNDTSKGTFSQRYWFTSQDYEDGGPILLMTPGESDADGYYTYLTNASIMGQISQQQKGAGVIIEHRFFGESNPYPDLSVQSLQYLNLAQSVADLEYFAKNVQLPMSGGDQVAPGQAPWILLGGSYSGALTAWTMAATDDVFFAGYASSAVVEAIVDFWAYFEPIREYMPQNCSADMQAVVAYFDEVFNGTNQTAMDALKEQFALNLTHADDVVAALEEGLFYWQDLQPTTGPGGLFFDFCDSIEVKNGTNAPASGWGLDYALESWGTFYSTIYIPEVCANETIEECLGTYDANSTYFTSTAVNNENRSWLWMVCTQLGFFQESAPEGNPSLVSRLLQPAYMERQCQQMFPEAFSEPPTPNATTTNSIYHGWNVQVDRLFFATGQRDPWRDATVSAQNRTVDSTSTQPVAMGDGFHCSDLATASGAADPTILAVQQAGLSNMKTWLATWKPSDANVSYSQPETSQFIPPTSARTQSTSKGQSWSGTGRDTKPGNAWSRSFGQF